MVARMQAIALRDLALLHLLEDLYKEPTTSVAHEIQRDSCKNDSDRQK